MGMSAAEQQELRAWANANATQAQADELKAKMQALVWDEPAADRGDWRRQLTDDQFRAAQILLCGPVWGSGAKLEMHGRAEELKARFGRTPTLWEYQNQMRGGGPLPSPGAVVPTPTRPPVPVPPPPPAPPVPPVKPPPPPVVPPPPAIVVPDQILQDLKVLTDLKMGPLTWNLGKHTRMARIAEFVRGLVKP